MERELNELELAWAAGFFDGEGSTIVNKSCNSLSVSISQVEVHPIERFRKAIGGEQRIIWSDSNGIHSYKESGADAYRVISLLFPYLSRPKQEQALFAMTQIILRPKEQLRPSAAYSICTRGHIYEEVGVYINPTGGKVCRKCRKMRADGNAPPIPLKICPPLWMKIREYEPKKGEKPWPNEVGVLILES